MTKEDENWIEKLWKWADDNDISDEIFPRDKDGLVNLTTLHLGYRKITKIPKEIGNLTNLTWLYLRDMQITEVPKEIGNLTNLTKLHLQDNQLTKLPKEIGNLTKLTRLDLRNNQLTKLPEEIVNLTNMRGISLSEDIPPGEVGEPQSRYELELTDEQIEWHFNIYNIETTDTELQVLFDYCQSDERICLKPYYWAGMYRIFRRHKDFMPNKFPVDPCILGGWWASDDNEKRLRFLTHIYWAYKHNIFYKVKKYITLLDDDKWYREDALELTLDEVKVEYEWWKNL